MYSRKPYLQFNKYSQRDFLECFATKAGVKHLVDLITKHARNEIDNNYDRTDDFKPISTIVRRTYDWLLDVLTTPDIEAKNKDKDEIKTRDLQPSQSDIGTSLLPPISQFNNDALRRLAYEEKHLRKIIERLNKKCTLPVMGATLKIVLSSSPFFRLNETKEVCPYTIADTWFVNHLKSSWDTKKTSNRENTGKILASLPDDYLLHLLTDMDVTDRSLLFTILPKERLFELAQSDLATATERQKQIIKEKISAHFRVLFTAMPVQDKQLDSNSLHLLKSLTDNGWLSEVFPSREDIENFLTQLLTQVQVLMAKGSNEKEQQTLRLTLLSIICQCYHQVREQEAEAPFYAASKHTKIEAVQHLQQVIEYTRDTFVLKDSPSLADEKKVKSVDGKQEQNLRVLILNLLNLIYVYKNGMSENILKVYWAEFMSFT